MKNQLNWNDLVFENRNKDYGAYALRNAYGGRVILAFIIALITLALVMAFPAIRKLFEDDVVAIVNTKEFRYTDLVAPPPIDRNTPPPQKVELPPPLKQALKFMPPKIVDKEVVVDETPPMEDLKNLDVAPVTTDGEAVSVFDDVVPDAVEEPEEDQNKVYTIVEQPAEFPGGFAAMMKWVSQNMKYPSQARRMGTEGNVFVQFVIDQQGQISEAKVVKGIGAGCDEEAVRVISKMPAWKPGKQNGKAVKSRFVLPLKFVLGS